MTTIALLLLLASSAAAGSFDIHVGVDHAGGMAAPAGSRPVLGIDPGLRTGCKCAALDGTGRFIEHQTLYLVGSRANQDRAREELTRKGSAAVSRHTYLPVGFKIGDVVAWIFNNEMGGYRVK